MRHYLPRFWAIALALLPAAAATPAMADMTAIYVENDGDLFTMEIADNGDVRAQHSDEAYAILIRRGEAYLIRPPTGKGQAFRVTDLVALRDRPAPPPRISYDREALGERIVGKWRGAAYTMHAKAERFPQAEIIVLGNEAKLKPLGRAVRRLLDGFFLPMARTMEQDSVPATYAFQAMTAGIGRRTPLIWSGMTLQSVSHQAISDARFALPGMAEAVAAPSTRSDRRCTIGGWTIDRSREGVEVRSRPSTSAPSAGKLPPFIPYKGGLHSGRGAEFSILGARNGWFRIADVMMPHIAGHDPEAADVVWSPSELEGWIPGTAIYFVLQTTKGFERPDPDSRVIFHGTDWYGPPGWHRVTDCQGEWVQIAYDQHRQEKRAWFRGVCRTQETTCDGIKGDD